MKKKSGFTLVEIMFAVAIIGLLASIGIPSVLHAMTSAKERTRAAHLTSIEKAKGMLTLPSLVYGYGQSLIEGAVFGEGDYTEETLLACLKNVDNLEDLAVDGYYLIPGNIGTKSSYSKTRPAYAEN